MHSNATTLIMPNDAYGINNTGMSSKGREIGAFSDLDKKNIDTINFTTCNSGRIETEDNIASNIVKTQDVNKVLCWNGSVAFDWRLQIIILDLGLYKTTFITPYAIPRVSNEQHIENDKKLGQLCYFIEDGVIYYYYVDNPDEIYEYGNTNEKCGE